MFELPTQPSSIVLETANVRNIILLNQDENNTDREISENKSEDLEDSTLSSNIEEDYLDNKQDVLHQDQAHCDRTLRTTRVPQPKK
jgi:hypothetical protein